MYMRDILCSVIEHIM